MDQKEKTYIITDRKGTRFLAETELTSKWDAASSSYVSGIKITWADNPRNARTFNKEQLDKVLLKLVGKQIAFREAAMHTYYSVWWYNGQVNEVKMPTSTCPPGFFKTRAEAAASALKKVAEHIERDEESLNERKVALENLRKIIAEAEPAAPEQQS